MKKEQLLAIAVAGAMIGVVVAQPAGAVMTVLASDPFVGPEDQSGPPVVGTQTPVGNLTWSAAADGYYWNKLWPTDFPPAYGGGGLALEGTISVPFNAAVHQEFSAQVDTVVPGTAQSGLPVLALGFGNATQSPYYVGLPLTVYLSYAGTGLTGTDPIYGTWSLDDHFNAITNGNLTAVSTWNSSREATNQVKLDYDVLTSTITLTIAGTQVYSGPDTVGPVGLASISSVNLGSTGMGNYYGAELRNFELDATIPEPSTIVLFGIGGFVLFHLRHGFGGQRLRRRNR